MATCMAVSETICAVVKGININVFNSDNHTCISIPKSCENDNISTVTISPDDKYIGILTSTSKKLLVYSLLATDTPKIFSLPRSASRARFTSDSSNVLIADKSGDVLIYQINDENAKGEKLLGHLSLLLDVLLTNDKKYIISCDRDEKIKVSCFPCTYNIQTFCLGHKEFVKHLELLPHNKKYLVSSSGDGTVKVWNYVNGLMCHNIDTSSNINDKLIQQQFAETMEQEGVEVTTLPIVHFSIAAQSENCSVIAVTLYNLNKILIYDLHENCNNFEHSLRDTILLEYSPSAIQFNDLYQLYVYNDIDETVYIYSVLENGMTSEFVKKIKMFNDLTTVNKVTDVDPIKVLFKRKFDNVQEYMERKKLRIENKNSS